jgi:heat shock protein HslJ
MRPRATAFLLTLTVLVAGVTACSGDDGVDAADLDGHTFVATGAEGQELVPEVEVRLAFADGFLNIDGGCNTINGSYQLDGDTITWSEEPFGTLIGCDPALQTQDEWLTALITEGATITLDGSALTLEGDEVTLELDEVDGDAAATAPLEGTTWLLSAIGEGDAFSERPGGVEAPTLQIDDGRAVVFTGCNNGSAAVEVTEDPDADGLGTITFEPLALTRVACEGESADVEAAQVAVLDGEVTYAFDAEGVTLTKDDRSLAYQTG